jgi:putative DNA primase/helicase
VNLRDVVTPIPDLDKILVASEGPGILNWLLDGYRDYRKNGFLVPECVKEATGDYRNQEDELASFVLDCCVVGDHCMVSAPDLFGEYVKWGGKKNKTVFGKEMGHRFKKDAPTAGEFRKKTMYYGIGITDAEF